MLILVSGCAGCDDQLSVDPDIPDVDYSELFGTGGDDAADDTTDEDVDDTGDDTGEPDNDQCTLDWAYSKPEGGVASHPIVSDGIATIVAGDTLRRIGKNGTTDPICDKPAVVPGEKLGTPAQDDSGNFWVGTTSGKLVRINKKCQVTDTIDIEEACGADCNELVKDGTPHAVREAPALGTNAHVYVLDQQPVLHKFNGDGDYIVPFVTLDERKRDAAPIYITPQDGGEAYVAFATMHTVAAVKAQNHVELWTFDAFVDDPADLEITSTMAVTQEGKVVFVGAKVAGSAHDEHKLYRLTAAGEAKEGVVDNGFPIALDLPLDTIHALVIAADESIYAATQAHGVIKFDKTGTELWRFIGDEESLRATTVPTLGDDGALYFTAEPHFFFGVDANGVRIARHEATGDLETTSPAVRGDGKVLVHFGTELRAYTCPTKGLQNSSWPRYQRNNRNSGNLQEIN